jgi:hypothetical protein
MRKGRSSRRSRSSRPLIGAKTVEALSTEVVSVGNPRVVVGIPPSEPPPSDEPTVLETKGTIDGGPETASKSKGVDPLEALEALDKLPVESEEDRPATLPSFGSTVVLGSPEPSADVASETAAPTEREEVAEKPNFASTLVMGSTTQPEIEPEAPSAKPDFASTLVMGSTAPKEETVAAPSVEDKPASFDTASDEAAPVHVPEPAPVPARVEEAALPEPKRVEAKADLAKTRGGKKKQDKKKAANATGPVNVDPDEISVPPAVDGAVDEQFFSDGDVARHLDHVALEGDSLTIPDKAKRKSEPHVVERRARFVRYVKWAVAGAAVVCVAAFARTTMSSKPAAPAERATMTMEAPPPTTKAAEPAVAPVATVAAEAVPAATSTTTAAEPAPSAAAEPPPPAEPAAAAAAAPSAQEPPAEPNMGDGNAKEEKAKARAFLEKRKIAEAIEAGERSVKLDPTDGEAWLLLGASYQEKGKMVEARRAYASCVKEATTGPRQECAKMLR